VLLDELILEDGRFLLGRRHHRLEIAHDLGDFLQRIGQIGVGEDAVPAARGPDPARDRKAFPSVLLVSQESDPLTRLCCVATELRQQLSSRGLAAIVDEDQLGRAGLSADEGPERFEMHCEAIGPVAHGDDERQVDFGRRHEE